MGDCSYAILDQRGVLAVEGGDACSFLQGLVSNDVRRVSPDQAVYAAFLTPQGKYLHDFFMVEHEGAILIDCEAARLADLKRRLGIYKLRSDVTLTDRSGDYVIAAVFGAKATAILGLPHSPGAAIRFGGGVAFVDPRLADAGARVILPAVDASRALSRLGASVAEIDAYDRHRIGLGLPDGSRDLVVEKSILLENGFDELHGIDWDKGCYMGQELTARTKYRGLVKKRLVPVAVDGALPQPGTPVMADGTDVGEIRSGADGLALALLRLDCLERAADAAPLIAEDARLTPKKPGWAAF
ncbi:MAG: folate-binding protein YgfZ [Rhodospirillales bacterium]|nr:folate-binding protein YgfZ [Rhodospirillales bacterium]